MGDESKTVTSWQDLYKEEVSKRLLLEATLSEKEKSLERALHKLKVEEQRYALAFHGSQDGLWDWDLKSGTLFLSQRWLAMLGFEPGELPSSLEGWIDRVYERDRKDLEAAIEAHFKEPSSTFSHEYRLRHKEGHTVWVLTRGYAFGMKQESLSGLPGHKRISRHKKPFNNKPFTKRFMTP
jgi:PAS domain S-box-containing protein